MVKVHSKEGNLKSKINPSKPKVNLCGGWESREEEWDGEGRKEKE